MKILHLSDLHLGKRVNEFSMLEDQTYILTEILSITDREHPDCICIAGDVYDKSVPSAEAVSLFDNFLVQLSQRHLPVLIISGNHDSPERIAFGGRIMEHSGIYLSPVYDGRVSQVTLEDAWGPVHFYLLPFIKPIHVRRFFPEESIESYNDAMKTVIGSIPLLQEDRNVLITHQFVTGSQRTDSEELSVGGTDNIDASLFSSFDYVALGHLHRPQNCTSQCIRYSGSPLKYSFSESRDKKSVTVVELGEKGDVKVSCIPLIPKRDMAEIRGTYEELTRKSYYEGTALPDSYLHITLTDEEDVPDAVGKLRILYPYLMKMDYDNCRTRSSQILEEAKVEQSSPLELFSDFYQQQNNQPLSPEQTQYITSLLETLKEEDSL